MLQLAGLFDHTVSQMLIFGGGPTEANWHAHLHHRFRVLLYAYKTYAPKHFLIFSQYFSQPAPTSPVVCLESSPEHGRVFANTLNLKIRQITDPVDYFHNIHKILMASTHRFKSWLCHLLRELGEIT